MSVLVVLLLTRPRILQDEGVMSIPVVFFLTRPRVIQDSRSSFRIFCQLDGKCCLCFVASAFAIKVCCESAPSRPNARGGDGADERCGFPRH